MRDAYDFSQLTRSSIGFDRMLRALEGIQRGAETAPTWPPYNISQVAEDAYRIDLAVAGFSQDELTITAQQNVLVVGGHKDAEANGDFLHRGISANSFERRFSLADFVKVKDASYENGILSINLAREIPDEMRPRRIPVGQAAGPKLVATAQAA